MDDNQRQQIARQLLGQGTIGDAADLQKMYPIWQKANIEAQMQGMAFPSFQEWSQSQMPQPIMKAGMF